MQHIAIVIACIFFCYGCDPAPGIFLANRSGNDKIIYMTGGNYNLLKDGYDITYRPLRSSFFNDEKFYIWNAINNYAEMKESGNVKNLMEKIELYHASTGKSATFIIAKDNSLILKPYNEPLRRMHITDEN